MNRKINTPSAVSKILLLILFQSAVLMTPVVSNSADFTLLYSNDIRGETDPCG